MKPEALSGIRVIDVAGTVATGYCGKLFADYGAEVINLEPGGGFTLRTLAPHIPGAPAGEASAMHAWLSVNKKSVVSDPGSAQTNALLAGADVVLDDASCSHLNQLAGLRVNITWFGQSGPYAGYKGTDGTCFALNGMLRGIGRVEGPPLIPTGYSAQAVGGISAFIGAMTQVLGNTLGNHPQPNDNDKGRTLETSIYESCLCFTDVGAVGFHNSGAQAPRMGINRFPPTYPLGVFPCRDGWLGVTVLTPSQWHTFCELLDMQDFADVPLFQSAIGRLQGLEIIEPVMREKFLAHSAEALFYAAQERAVPLARVPTMDELFNVDQFVGRQAFVDAQLPGGNTLSIPNVPFRLFNTPPRAGGPVARLGEHNDVLLRSSTRETPGTPPPTRKKRAQSSVAGTPTTLAGIRIVDLSMGWAGPLAARSLADMGADVIKVESCERFDWWRSWEATPEWIADDGAEKSTAFNTMNRNKRNLTLDLESTEGRDLLLRLVASADAVIENFSGSVLPKLKLGYDVFREVQPNIILMSMPAFGSTGRWANFRAYGSTVEQSSGLPHLNGVEGEPPTMLHVALGDAIGGLNGAAAMLIALQHQAVTGQGQFLDLSQVEALFPLAAHGILEYAATGHAPPRAGNRHREFAPHGVYPCAGEDEWILIQVTNEQEWLALQRRASPTLDSFGNRETRMADLTRLDAAIAEWTKDKESGALMALLQQAGVPAASTHDARRVLEDPHLAARDYWQWLDRAVVGRQPNPSSPSRFGNQPFPIAAPAPTLGQHNHEVLRDIGVSDADLTRLEASGIIGTKPRMPGKR